jgi:hypothetical protein
METPVLAGALEHKCFERLANAGVFLSFAMAIAIF